MSKQSLYDIDAIIGNRKKQLDQHDQQEQDNPFGAFDDGMRRAIEASQKTIAPSLNQQNQALGSGLVSWGQGLEKQPKKKGLWANLALGARALAPAIQTYEDKEGEFIKNNRHIHEHIQKRQEEHKKSRASIEDKLAGDMMKKVLYSMQQQHHEDDMAYKEKALEEQREYHRGKNSGNVNIGTDGLVDGKYIPFASKSERLPFSKKLAGANITSEHVKHAIQVMEDLTQRYKGKFSTLPAGIGHFYGRGQELYGSLAGDQNSLNEGLARQKMDQVIGTLAVKFEKELKGGILTGDMVSRFEAAGLIPTKWDSPASVAQKLETMNHEIELERNIAEQSLLKNAYYKGAVNLPGQGEEQGSGAYKPQKVRMVDPKTQIEIEIPAEAEDVYIEQGYIKRDY